MARKNPQTAGTRPWQRLYGTARWQRLRRAQLQTHPLCAMCAAEGRVTPATIADHVIPHKGDQRLFFEGELASLCKAHHDRDKQREERLGYSTAVGADGWPIDPNHPANR